MATYGYAPAKIALTCLAGLFIFSGCNSTREYINNGFKVGPNYKRAAVPVADDWIDSSNPRVLNVQQDCREWWTIFNDPVLNHLVQLSYQQNITLREAGFRVMEARAQRGVVAGNLFPQAQSIDAGYNRIQQSTETALYPDIPPGSPFSNLSMKQYNQFRIGGSFAWELDFWGRYRRAIEAADARLDSSVEEYDEVLVLLVGDVAQTYIEFRTIDQRLAVARENASLQSESARVAQARFDAMAVNSELDTPQAKANLGNTLAVVEALEIQRRKAQNRLAILMGMPPHDLSYLLVGANGIPVVPHNIGVGVPAELIWRRPDIRKAERLVAAQSADIGVATSELYPHISINGTLAWEAGSFSDVFKTSALGGTIGPSFQWNILNYGRLLNNIRAHDARFQQLIASYQQAVLNANEEAENAIVSFLHYSDQVLVLEQSAKEAESAEHVAQIKYREGEIDFNRLFTVQQLLLSQQEALVTAQGNTAQSVVDLYRALGGGWEIRLGNPQGTHSLPEWAAATPPLPETAPEPLTPQDLPPMPEVKEIQE